MKRLVPKRWAKNFIFGNTSYLIWTIAIIKGIITHSTLKTHMALYVKQVFVEYSMEQLNQTVYPCPNV